MDGLTQVKTTSSVVQPSLEQKKKESVFSAKQEREFTLTMKLLATGAKFADMPEIAKAISLQVKTTKFVDNLQKNPFDKLIKEGDHSKPVMTLGLGIELTEDDNKMVAWAGQLKESLTDAQEQIKQCRQGLWRNDPWDGSEDPIRKLSIEKQEHAFAEIARLTDPQGMQFIESCIQRLVH